MIWKKGVGLRGMGLFQAFFMCVFEKLKGRKLKLFSKLKAKNSRSFPKLKVSEVSDQILKETQGIGDFPAYFKLEYSGGYFQYHQKQDIKGIC